MKNNQVVAGLLALVLFCGGVIAGVLGDRYYVQNVVHARPGAERLRERYVEETRRKLNLTDQQLKQLNTILDDTRAKMRAFRESHHAEFDQITQDQNQRVRAMLRPDQIPAYEQLRADQERRWHRDHHD